MPPRKQAPPPAGKAKKTFDAAERVKMQFITSAGIRHAMHRYALDEHITVYELIETAVMEYMQKRGFKP